MDAYHQIPAGILGQTQGEFEHLAYQSGTDVSLQHPMGLYGPVVHYQNASNGVAIPGFGFDREARLFYSEIDPALNDAEEGLTGRALDPGAAVGPGRGAPQRRLLDLGRGVAAVEDLDPVALADEDLREDDGRARRERRLDPAIHGQTAAPLPTIKKREVVAPGESNPEPAD